jgi:hypothetical protein
MRRRSCGWKKPKIWDLFLLTLAWAVGVEAGGPVRSTTYDEKTMQRWQTPCDDGSRETSTFNRTLERWDTTITESSRRTCTGQMNPKTRQVEVRCR